MTRRLPLFHPVQLSGGMGGWIGSKAIFLGSMGIWVERDLLEPTPLADTLAQAPLRPSVRLIFPPGLGP